MYVSYYRVSTRKQGRSGLGLEAQRKTVQDFIASDRRRILVGEYTDIESGKNDARPHLLKAIAHAKKVGATLLIAKLDRLSRNVSFIFTLRDTRVEFKALDLPDMNTLTVGIFASVAQYERERTSERLRDAFGAKCRRGEVMGYMHNLTDNGRAKGAKSRMNAARTDDHNVRATELIEHLRKQGLTYRSIARRLNDKQYTTSRGNQFEAMSVKRLFDRAIVAK